MEGESEPDELEENLMTNTTSTFFPGGQTSTTSFQGQGPHKESSSSRRAPVMGNRGLESQRIQQERSRSKSKGSSHAKDSSRSRGSPRTSRKSSSQDAQVVALDERNLKRAVNRYGTMPKGARIGKLLNYFLEIMFIFLFEIISIPFLSMFSKASLYLVTSLVME